MPNFLSVTLTSGTTSQPVTTRDRERERERERERNCIKYPGFSWLYVAILPFHRFFSQISVLFEKGDDPLISKEQEDGVTLTSEVELLYGFPQCRLFVLVVGDGGVLEHKPVLLVRSQGQFPRPETHNEQQSKYQ